MSRRVSGDEKRFPSRIYPLDFNRILYYNKHSSMRTLQYTTPRTVSSTDFSTVTPDAKNSSLSFGGGYSQSSGWNANVTFTKKW